MKKAKSLLVLLMALAMTASLAGCSTPSTSTATEAAETEAAEEAAETEAAEEAAEATETESGEKVFRYASTTEPTTLDPTMGNSIADNEIQHAVTMGLVRCTAGEVTPDAAESWEISEDGLTYTFHLREGLVWSDGEPVTADQYVYGMQRLADPETGSPYAWILGTAGIKNANDVMYNGGDMETLGVSAPDESTVVIELENPATYFLSLMGTCCQFTAVRQDLVEEYGKDFAAKAENNVYAGPFKLVSSDNMKYVFEPNENYWDADSIHWDRVELSIVSDSSTQLAMYESGDLDFVYVPVEQVPNYDDVDEAYLNGNCDFVYINCSSETQPLLQDANFRLALNYGLNRTAYIALATNNVYEPSTHITMPLVQGVEKTYGEEYFDTGIIEGYPVDGDEELAKEYLQKAMDAAGISDPSEIVLEYTTTDNETNKKIAEVCQELWQQSLGITVNIRQVTYSEIYGTVFPSGDYEVGYGGWGPDFSDPYTYVSLWKSDIGYATNGSNYSQYKNEEFDALLESAVAETDAQARMDMLADAEKILLADGANVPLQNRMQHYLIDDDITGVEFFFCAVNLDWVYGDCQ